MKTSALFLDFYELTMAQGCFFHKPHECAVFEVLFRKHPFAGGYSIFAGLDPLLTAIEQFRFSGEDIDYLRTLHLFHDDFLSYLASFRFSGDIHALEEGSVIFPHEPIIRVHARLVEALLLEGLILNTINFQSLIATKTARMWRASGEGVLMEFGLRRAQGYDGALSATRAAAIGGATGTSNTLAAKLYGIRPMGTMAHAWVMSFDSEEEAFERYAALYGSASVFLIDTYHTLESGIQNAIAIGTRLKAAGKSFGVRLDSGDMQYLSVQVRAALDAAGLPEARIAVSNELDETIIESLVLSGAPIDAWGVGTHLVTGGADSAFTGVYKMSARATTQPAHTQHGHAASQRLPHWDDAHWLPVMKVSDNPAKTTTPGIKQVWRLYDAAGQYKADVIGLADEVIEPQVAQRYIHPFYNLQSFTFAAHQVEPLLRTVMQAGNRLRAGESVQEIHARMRAQLQRLDKSYVRLLNPHVYKVSLTERLAQLKNTLITALRR
ncbi:nicotinate phosphoribosyltransferase [Treponema pallidum]|uniref:nicotinate phosphoribosyltransferase n=1 Tax=Treponema pallidum TaxID=160 RepID=UPI00244ECC08|nr:nicotinate phosphoribosyltransferase [Treponema pallidum]WGK72091.1 nicotinate phosphoribosyltransferase [Treponema pallidum subsp. pertenue]WGK75984.1 nicotinate phosphoribosyltransferase [Treponema pallidum subsp. pertenue]